MAGGRFSGGSELCMVFSGLLYAMECPFNTPWTSLALPWAGKFLGLF